MIFDYQDPVEGVFFFGVHIFIESLMYVSRAIV